MDYVSRFHELGPPFYVDLDQRDYLMKTFYVQSLGFWSESEKVYEKSVVCLRLAKLVKVVK